LQKKWNPIDIFIESNGYQQALTQELIETSMLPIEAVNNTINKSLRILSISPYFENKKILLPRNHPELENFIDEYVYFPRGTNDDMLDSLELALNPLKESPIDMDPYLIVGGHPYNPLR
jgi:predicted phage terminase large subunit-like protein